MFPIFFFNSQSEVVDYESKIAITRRGVNFNVEVNNNNIISIVCYGCLPHKKQGRNYNLLFDGLTTDRTTLATNNNKNRDGERIEFSFQLRNSKKSLECKSFFVL